MPNESPTTLFDIIKRGILDQDVQTVADALTAVKYLQDAFQRIDAICSLNSEDYREGFSDIGNLAGGILNGI
jgi:hypothetical protein